MRPRNITLGCIALVAATVVAACDDTAGLDAIEDAAVRDMALVAVDATLEDVNTLGQPFGFQSGQQGLGGPGRPGGHFGLGADGSGTTVRTFYDATGAVQEEYDELTTARIEVETIVDGEVARENWTAVVHRERRMTITGLEGPETHRTYNGTGSSETSGSRHTDQGDRTYNMIGSSTFTDVVTPVPGSDPSYPVSGVISRSIIGTRTDAEGTQTRSIEMTVTFDGDGTAIAVVNGQEFEIDLSAREGRRPWGRRGPGS